jgi:hypothetical protein
VQESGGEKVETNRGVLAAGASGEDERVVCSPLFQPMETRLENQINPCQSFMHPFEKCV